MLKTTMEVLSKQKNQKNQKIKTKCSFQNQGQTTLV